MLTPVELQNKTFKSGGLGYDKKDVEQFFHEVTEEYTRLYSENIDLKDKVGVLNDALQHYKTMEESLQRALVLAEKTAEDTMQAAEKNAQNIEKEAQLKSQLMLSDARNELERVNARTLALLQQFEKYKIQFKSIVAAQLELLESETYSLNADKPEASVDSGRMALPRGEEKTQRQKPAEGEETAPPRTEKKPAERGISRAEGFSAERKEGAGISDRFGGMRFPERPVRRQSERVRTEPKPEQREEDATEETPYSRFFGNSRPAGNSKETSAEPRTERQAERSPGRGEEGSYWPDGRFPGRSVRKPERPGGKAADFSVDSGKTADPENEKNVSFVPDHLAADKKEPETTDENVAEGNGETDGFDFIDL